MGTLCPYCHIEVSESSIEAEDGCCPECGAVITAASSIFEDDHDDDFDNEFDDDFDDDDYDEFGGDVDDLDDIDGVMDDEEDFDDDFDR